MYATEACAIQPLRSNSLTSHEENHMRCKLYPYVRYVIPGLVMHIERRWWFVSALRQDWIHSVCMNSGMRATCYYCVLEVFTQILMAEWRVKAINQSWYVSKQLSLVGVTVELQRPFHKDWLHHALSSCFLSWTLILFSQHLREYSQDCFETS